MVPWRVSNGKGAGFGWQLVRRWLASLAAGKKGVRERCTLRRFRIRGLIEGMLRTVMGNICSGHKAQVGRSAKSQEGNKLTSRPKEGNGVNEMQRGKGKKQRNKCKSVNNRDIAKQGEIKERRDQGGKERKSEKGMRTENQDPAV